MFKLNENERLLVIQWRYGGMSPSDGGSGIWYFAVSNVIPKGSEETKLREAIRNHYQNLPEGSLERLRRYSPNWGDAMDEVNFEGTGFRLLDSPQPEADFSVDHDEWVFKFND